MKEDGIGKLIELLNEYDDGMVSWYEEYFPTEGLFVTNAGQGFREEFILGKRYGFIKRLVENDKIDYNKEDFIVNACHYIHNASNYDGLLMLLSIQDNPIEFLISILKDKKAITEDDENITFCILKAKPDEEDEEESDL